MDTWTYQHLVPSPELEGRDIRGPVRVSDTRLEEPLMTAKPFQRMANFDSEVRS